MKRSLTVEKSFKRMLDNNPDKICINAIESILAMLERDNIDVSLMRRMFEKKKESAQIYILPLSLTKEGGVV